ncbi:MAG: limonene-1,2-epoxide hydrolase family protein [Pseudomonadota bacterium]
MTELDLTRQFIASWETGNIDDIIRFCTDDIVYHNIPLEPLYGKEALKAFASPLLEMSHEVSWDILAIAQSNDGRVLTERVDRFSIADGKSITIRVMGIFRWNTDQLLAEWRDYFDLTEFQSQLPQAT